MTDEILTKVCTLCKQEKAADQFSRDYNSKKGLCTRCKECQKAYYREYNSRPEVIERASRLRKLNRKRPEVKAVDRKYQKEYLSRPEVKAARAAYAREYRKRPGEKERGRELGRKAYHRNKNNSRYKALIKANQKRWHEKSPRLNIHMALRHATRRRTTINPATTDQLMEMWRRQEGKCAVSGVTMTWGKGKIMPTSVSLDRYDGTKGYELENIRLVCFQVNTFRGRWSDDQMLEMARAIVTNMESQRKLKVVS